MRVEVAGRKIIITLPDKSRENERAKVLSDLRHVHFDEWIDENTVAFDLDVHNERATITLVGDIGIGARIFGASISSEAEDLFKKYEELRRLKEEEKERMERAERERRRAVDHVTNGCGWCESLKWDGKRWMCKEHEKPCRESMAEVEMLFELWKESGYRDFQRPTPFPVAECKYLEVLK